MNHVRPTFVLLHGLLCDADTWADFIGPLSRLGHVLAANLSGIDSLPDAARGVLADPCHPYTRGLLRSAPTLKSSRDNPLVPIPGQPPQPGSIGGGAPFRSRCPVSVAGVCETARPGWSEAGPGHLVACHRFAQDGRRGLP